MSGAGLKWVREGVIIPIKTNLRGDLDALVSANKAKEKHSNGQSAAGGPSRSSSPSTHPERAENDPEAAAFRGVRSLSSALNSVGGPRPGFGPLSALEKEFRLSSEIADADDAFFPPATARHVEHGGPDLRLFTGGLTDYARLASQPAAHDEDDGSEQRLAERFASRPVEPVHIPERPLMQALVPYLAAAGFFVFAGTGSAIYFFKSGSSSDWSASGGARAAIVSTPKIDSALTTFVPKALQDPVDQRAIAPAEEDADEAPTSTQPVTWADTVETFKVLASPKPVTGPAKPGSDANHLLRAVEAWPKNGR